jgi:pimeloyl-ACP methyl ester carboxylesterase
MITVRERQVVVDEGVELYARCWNDGDGIPMVLVHGLASNCRTWEAVARRIHDLGHPVAAVDQRGHGQSDKPPAGYDYDTLCGDLLHLFDALRYERPVVVGQSFGGNLVVEFAFRFPERTAAIVGVDGGFIEHRRRFSTWEECERVLAPPSLESATVASLEARIRSEHPGWSEEGVAGTMANFELLADGGVRARLPRDQHMQILRVMWEHPPSEVIPAITVPITFVVAGGREASADRVGPTGQAHIVWFPGADHDIHVQHPKEVADLIRMGLAGPALS